MALIFERKLSSEVHTTNIYLGENFEQNILGLPSDKVFHFMEMLRGTCQILINMKTLKGQILTCISSLHEKNLHAS